MRGMFRKKAIAAAVAALALVGGGAAVAATQLGSDANEQAILSDAAKRLGVDPADLGNALEQAYAARIDAAVAAGRLTREQGDELKQRLKDGELPLVGGPFLDGHRGFHGPHLLVGLDAAASYLGLTEAQLHDRLASGKTLADVAKDEGKTVDGLKQALVDEAKTHLDQAVADGRLTQAQEDDILAELRQRLDDLVDGRGFPMHGPGFGRRPHHGGAAAPLSAA